MKEMIRNYCREIKEDFARVFTKPVLIEQVETPSLLDFLPYEEFHKEYGVFENKKTVGFILKLSHFAGIDEKATKSLRSIITNDLPAECFVQIINYASPKIGDALEYWYESGTKNRTLQKIAEKRRNFFQTGSWKSILGNRKNLLLRDFELYMCCSVTKVQARTAQEALYHRLNSLKDKIAQGLKSINCDVSVLTPLELSAFVREIINPSDSIYKSDDIAARDPIVSNKNLKRLFISTHKVEMQETRIVFSDQGKKFHYVVFEVTDWPQEWSLANSIEYMGRFDEGSTIPCPFYISYGFQLQSSESSSRAAEKYRIVKTKQADSKLPMFFPKMIEEIEDWRYVSERLSQGERLGEAQMFIVLCVQDLADEERCAQITKDHFACLGFKVERVRYDTLNALLCTLPFGLGENDRILKTLKIPSKKLSEACINLMPVFADIKNYTSPLMMFAGRKGQLFFFDNFKSAENANGNYNMVVVGKSGTGKSVFLQEYAVANLRFGGQVVILDDGRSFENSCILLDGDLVNFGGGDFCINPFSLYQEKESTGLESNDEYKEYFEEPFIDLIVSILCIIINLDKNDNKDPKVGLYRAVMAGAIASVMKKKGSSAGFKDIQEELQNNPLLRSIQVIDIADRIAFVLESYSTGRYAKYFNGKATLDIKNVLTVFEFSDLERNEVLQNSVLLIVVFLVYSKMRGRTNRTSLIIDEAWRLLKHEAMKGFISGIARRARKYNGSIVLATQSMSDFSNSEVAAAVLSQSDWRVLLSVSGSDHEVLKKQLGFSEGEIAIAQNLVGLKGAYSEFMLKNSDGSWQIGRLLLDSFSAKLFSTTAQDVVAIRNMRAKGLSVEEAIETLVRGQ